MNTRPLNNSFCHAMMPCTLKDLFTEDDDIFSCCRHLLHFARAFRIKHNAEGQVLGSTRGELPAALCRRAIAKV